jgi:hypothetical protein
MNPGGHPAEPAAAGAMAGPASSSGAARLAMVVVIPTHRRPELLERTLRSLLAAPPPPELREIRVVENGPGCGARDGVEPLAREAPCRVTFRQVLKANKSAALNEAIRDLDEEFVVLLDDDVRVSETCLGAYAEGFAEHPEGAFFGGPFGCDYEREPPDWLRPHLPKSALGWGAEDGPLLYGRWLPFIGFNWAVRAREMKAVGGFREEFGPGSTAAGTGQDTMAQQALLAAGLEPVFLAGARVHHWVPASRCSPQWCLHRARRNAISDGYRALPDRDPASWRAILYDEAVALLNAIRALLPRGFGRLHGPETFGDAHRFYYAVGLLQGSWRRFWRMDQAGPALSAGGDEILRPSPLDVADPARMAARCEPDAPRLTPRAESASPPPRGGCSGCRPPGG